MGLAVLELFVLPRETLVFRLLPGADRPSLIRLPVGRSEVRALVDSLVAFLERAEPSTGALQEAYSALMARAVDDLPEQVTRLVIIPHDQLHHVPFAALWSGSGYLGERFAISQLPSLQALHYIRERSRRAGSPCLAVGAAPGDAVFLQRSLEGEAEEVARRFGVAPILGADAHRERLLPLLAGTQVLHFSLHGRFVPHNALHSGLRLSPVPAPGPGEGAVPPRAADTLTARDFLRCGLDADLVVLGACQTGVSRIHPGDELEGLTQALLFAGAASVLVSLWPVDTVATRELMRAFYEAWHGQGETKAGALRHACEHIRTLSLAQVLESAARELTASQAADRLRIQVELGDIHHRLGWWNEAEGYYRHALALAAEMGLTTTDAPLVRSSLGQVLAARQRQGEAPGPPRDARAIHLWSAPYFWAPFILVGEWRK